jgi:hypothetical protein
MSRPTHASHPVSRQFPSLRQIPAALALAVCSLAAVSLSTISRAQEKPMMEIARDCQTFAISNNGKIVCAVPRVKRVKKVVIQRADIWVADSNGKDKLIVEGEKFMPVPTAQTPPESYIVNALAWSPDGSRVAMSITTEKPSSEEESASTTRSIALLDEEGHEIKVEGSKTRFIDDAANGAWLADNATVVYLIGAGPYKIGRVSTVTGQNSTLFEGHTFEAVVWDAKSNQAFALGQNLSLSGREAIVQLDLLHEGIKEVARIEAYQGALSLSPSGKKIAFFDDGDTIEVRDLNDPSKPIRVRAGMGVFGWSRDERRVLLKRGPADKSGELIWVGLYDGTFVPALHGLEYHAFTISPSGDSIAVTQPGKEVLRVYPLQ